MSRLLGNFASRESNDMYQMYTWALLHTVFKLPTNMMWTMMSHLCQKKLQQVTSDWICRQTNVLNLLQYLMWRVYSRQGWMNMAQTSTSLCTAEKMSCSTWGSWLRCCFLMSCLQKLQTAGRMTQTGSSITLNRLWVLVIVLSSFRSLALLMREVMAGSVMLPTMDFMADPVSRAWSSSVIPKLLKYFSR